MARLDVALGQPRADQAAPPLLAQAVALPGDQQRVATLTVDEEDHLRPGSGSGVILLVRFRERAGERVVLLFGPGSTIPDLKPGERVRLRHNTRADQYKWLGRGR